MTETDKLNHQHRPGLDACWLKPGRLLAGEHPRALTDQSSCLKLRQPLAVGVTFFLALTEAGAYGLKGRLLSGAPRLERRRNPGPHCPPADRPAGREPGDAENSGPAANGLGMTGVLTKRDRVSCCR